MPSMPKVRDSSGTIGTTRGPMSSSRTRVWSARTNAIVVERVRSPLSPSSASKAERGGTSVSGTSARRAGRLPPSASRRSRR